MHQGFARTAAEEGRTHLPKKTSSPLNSYADSRPPRIRMVVSNTETSRCLDRVSAATSSLKLLCKEFGPKPRHR